MYKKVSIRNIATGNKKEWQCCKSSRRKQFTEKLRKVNSRVVLADF